MKILLMLLVHRVEKIVKKPPSGVESFCLGDMLSGLVGLCRDSKERLDFFWGGMEWG